MSRLIENLKISRDGVDLKSRPTLPCKCVRKIEGASSAMKKLESDFDSVFGPDELGSESQLGPATSDHRHVSNECTDQGCTDPKRKR